MFLVPGGRKSMLRVMCAQCDGISHFPYRHIAKSDTLTYINASSDCFPERTVTLDVESTITCRFIAMVWLLCSLA